MNKTVKKLDNSVVKALTKVCARAIAEIPDFVWLTHKADFSNFPNSLVVTCVFQSNESLQKVKQQKQDIMLTKWVQGELLKVGILLKQAKRNLAFDSEEAGAKQRLLESKAESKGQVH